MIKFLADLFKSKMKTLLPQFPVKRYAVVIEPKVTNPKPARRAKPPPEPANHHSSSENSEAEEPPIRVKLKKPIEPPKKLKKVKVAAPKVVPKENLEKKSGIKKRGRPPKNSVKKEEKVKANFIPPIRPAPSTKYAKKKPDKKENGSNFHLYRTFSN